MSSEAQVLFYFLFFMVMFIGVKGIWKVLHETDPEFSIGQCVQTEKGRIGKIVEKKDNGHYIITLTIGGELVSVIQHFSCLRAREN